MIVGRLVSKISPTEPQTRPQSRGIAVASYLELLDPLFSLCWILYFLLTGGFTLYLGPVKLLAGGRQSPSLFKR